MQEYCWYIIPRVEHSRVTMIFVTKSTAQLHIHIYRRIWLYIYNLGANIADASYEDRTIYINDVVNTSMIGTYSLVYTALDDPAGNPGPNITRIITVSDSTPRMLNSLSLSTSNNNLDLHTPKQVIT